ncbi:hypothetical protein BS47DRAFT_414613 [Hydnum rufescens UP504]|uniref:Peptidyl-prolyl cis-trans isomerase n=1 Tax=Hydnum rufescens UP504 TaxID=1448309 RepID=A0A9P6BDK0_9AGAM|nr:hypothetical protein BS47DRAFT_414613 [Hydnum rufescens UP504]
MLPNFRRPRMATSAGPGAASSVTSPSERPVCFLDISIGGEPVGRLRISLFRDELPFTCDNFIALCTGEMGVGKTFKMKLHYKGASFHRVIKGFVCQSGDFTCQSGDYSDFTGKGGESIYGLRFKDETTDSLFTRRGLVAVANNGADDCGSQFFITFNPASHLNGRAVAFGELIDREGFEILKLIEDQPTKPRTSYVPLNPIVITDCGILRYHPGPMKTRYYSSDPDIEHPELKSPTG